MSFTILVVLYYSVLILCYIDGKEIKLRQLFFLVYIFVTAFFCQNVEFPDSSYIKLDTKIQYRHIQQDIVFTR